MRCKEFRKGCNELEERCHDPVREGCDGLSSQRSAPTSYLNHVRILEVALVPQLVGRGGGDEEEEEHKRRVEILLPIIDSHSQFGQEHLYSDPLCAWIEGFSYADERDRELAILFVQVVPGSFRHLPDAFRDDDQIVSLAVQNWGRALEWASSRLQDNKEIVLAVVQKYGLSPHASKRLRDDREVVLLGVKKNGKGLLYASDRLKDDREVVLLAVKNEYDGMELEYASDRLKGDRALVLEAVESYPHIFDACFDSKTFFQPYREDTEILKTALRKDGTVLENLGGAPFTKTLSWIKRISYQSRKELVLVAVEQTSLAFWHIRSSLVHDPDVLRAYRASVTRARVALAEKRGLPAETFLALERPREMSILADYADENEVEKPSVWFRCSCCTVFDWELISN